MARLFISHSSVNDAEAKAIRDWLAAEGWDDVFLDLDPERGVTSMADRRSGRPPPVVDAKLGSRSQLRSARPPGKAAARPAWAPSTWHVQIHGRRDGLSDARRYA